MSKVTVEQALKHPNWSMGGKITIDSATLMNKGLEVIEAHWLFNMPYKNIDVVVHPQSIIHSLVEFTDNSVVAQLGWPDMKLPIQYALSYPQRWGPALESLDLVKVGSMTFEAPDMAKFPCLGLAFEAGKTGGIMPCVLNAANEVAVYAFMQRKTGFMQIPEIIAATMQKFVPEEVVSIEQLIEVDSQARKYAEEILLKA
jgi:1-deoxy-D-xylulose-5-phosphate reductoisomerase